VGCCWRCCVQEDGSTALMVACEEGDMDIVTLLLARPGVDVNVADVSCVSGKRVHAVISHRHVRWEPEVKQDGWVWGRVGLKVDCVGGRLWLALLCAEVHADCSDGGLFEWSHGHRGAAAGGARCGCQCR
jgi:hypothetical protein